MFLPMQLDALLRQSNGFQIWKVKKEIPGITKYRLVKISTFCKNWKNKVAAQLELCTQANHNSALSIASALIILLAVCNALITASGDLKKTKAV